MLDDRINAAVLEEFIKKVRLASKSGQKELRIPLPEAENLVHNLSIIAIKLLDRQQTSVQSPQEQIVTIAMDGGSL
jgi:hypothetical protein